jgi:cation diffusion facilitator CzcD-associated flavoprotein CzcO
MSGEHHEIVIVGAGFAGIGLAIKLRDAGFEDVVVLERAEAIGGTWRDNTYPGCSCDTASHLYSFSFAPNPDWSRAYAGQGEILAYLERLARERDVERHVRTGCEVLEAAWDEEARRWALRTSRGPLSADFLVTATGPFGDPVAPEIPGLERFRGACFHSARWDHDHEFGGERVAVIGTGASAIQVIPQLQPEVERLLVFQRTPAWILPRFDRGMSERERAALRRHPAVRKALRGWIYLLVEGFGSINFVDRRFVHLYQGIARWHLRRAVRDPELRRRLTPSYAIGCKRVLVSDDYLPTFNRSNVELISDPIAEVRPDSIVVADGTEHRVDAIVLGTGFEVPTRQLQRIRGRDGRTSAELYAERPRSYLGVAVAGFPNLFTTLGVFSAAGNQSALYMLESQFAYIVDALRAVRGAGAGVIEVRPEVQERFVREAEERSRDTVWLTGGCRSYYTTPDGRNSGLWPGWSFEYRRRTRRFDPSAYRLAAG